MKTIIKVCVALAWLTLAHVGHAGGFHDGISCTYQGYLYIMPDDQLDFGSASGCTGIKWRIDQENHALILWSPHTVVTIPVPFGRDGQTLFQYRWGNTTAQIGGQPHAVHAEPTRVG